MRDGELVGQEVVFDHRQDECGRTDFQVGRDLGQVGVADDHVQPPVPLGVGVRLVAGVDDRTLQCCLEPYLDLEEVGPLRDLETRSGPSWPSPTRPAPHTTWRDTKNGTRWRMIEANGVVRFIR